MFYVKDNLRFTVITEIVIDPDDIHHNNCSISIMKVKSRMRLKFKKIPGIKYPTSLKISTHEIYDFIITRTYHLPEVIKFRVKILSRLSHNFNAPL